MSPNYFTSSGIERVLVPSMLTQLKPGGFRVFVRLRLRRSQVADWIGFRVEG